IGTQICPHGQPRARAAHRCPGSLLRADPLTCPAARPYRQLRLMVKDIHSRGRPGNRGEGPFGTASPAGNAFHVVTRPIDVMVLTGLTPSAGERGAGLAVRRESTHDAVVPTLSDLVARHTALDEADLDWLHSLVSDWQLLADLSFADLILWAPLLGENGWIAIAQMRPTTGPTVYHDDVVGSIVLAGERPLIDTAWAGRRICREGDPDWSTGVPAHEMGRASCRGRVQYGLQLCSRIQVHA